MQGSATVSLRTALPADTRYTKTKQAALRIRVQAEHGLGGTRDPRLAAEDRPLLVTFVPDGVSQRPTED